MSSSIDVRPMREADLDVADRITRVAFGTFRGLPDPAATFGDAEAVRTRFRAAPECAWVAEADGDVVGSVLAARWGSFAFFGPLTVDPAWWNRGIGSRLLQPVLEAFAQWNVRQAGLFTFPNSPKHLGLYQKHGFWPGSLIAVTSKAVGETVAVYACFSELADSGGPALLDDLRGLAHSVFDGLDLEGEVLAVWNQGLGDTLLLHDGDRLVGMAVCHVGAGSEAGSGACYVKFAAVRPGGGAAASFERLLDACEAFAASRGAERLVAGISTARLDAYRRVLARGFRTELLGVAMHLRPDEAHLDTPDRYVLDDLR
jgi:GNAT superfamily N-acetyltransferase